MMKFVLYAVVVMIIVLLARFSAEVMSPTVQTTLAVEQLQDSDAAHVELRSYEIGRNTVYVAVWLGIIAFTIVYWRKEGLAVVAWVKGKMGW